MDQFLKKTEFLDFDDDALGRYAIDVAKEGKTLTEKAILIFNSVRDGWRYNPYDVSLKKEAMIASNIFKKEEGHCIDKAIILTSCLRKNGIPARMCVAKVMNHIATEKYESYLGTKVLVPHGYVELYLNGKWIRVVPAFNKTLCEKLNVDVLEFDGEQDAMFQSYDKKENKFMEYLEDYGHFEDIPVDLFVKLMKENYPKLFKEGFDIEKLGMDLK